VEVRLLHFLQGALIDVVIVCRGATQFLDKRACGLKYMGHIFRVCLSCLGSGVELQDIGLRLHLLAAMLLE
jgi:hypothetical protein